MSGMQWEPAAGDTLGGRFEILEEIGEGGFSTVWKGLDTSTGDTIAIKHPNPNVGKSWKVVQKYFGRELQVLQTLQDHGGHVNIMTLLDHGEERGLDYMIVEYVDGELLEDVGVIDDTDQASDIAAQICDVFSHLHVHEIYYRDLKPDNIMLTSSGNIKLIDFNTARTMPKCANCEHVIQFQNLDSDGCPNCGSELNRGTQIQAGMNRYKPPEVSSSDNEYPQGPWSDVYSIGKILYFLLCGMVVQLPEEDPRDDRQDTPDYLADIIVKATDLDPPRRYRNASMMKEAIEQRDPDFEPPKARIRNTDTGQTYSVAPGDSLGRSNSSGPFATIVVDDPTPKNLISRVHAVFDYRNGQWLLSDRSTNGTVIKNGDEWSGILFPGSWDGPHDDEPPQHAVLSDGALVAVPRPNRGVTFEFLT